MYYVQGVVISNVHLTLTDAHTHIHEHFELNSLLNSHVNINYA